MVTQSLQQPAKSSSEEGSVLQILTRVRAERRPQEQSDDLSGQEVRVERHEGRKPESRVEVIERRRKRRACVKRRLAVEEGRRR